MPNAFLHDAIARWCAYGLLAVCMGLSGCAVKDYRSDENLAKADVNPTYIPAYPLGQTIAVYVGASIKVRDVPASRHMRASPEQIRASGEPYVEAFRARLIEDLRLRGYQAVDAGSLKTICPFRNQLFPECTEYLDREDLPFVLASLKEKGLSTALMIQLVFFEEHEYAIKDERKELRIGLRAKRVMTRMIDQSGLVLRSSMADMSSGPETVMPLGKAADGLPQYVLMPPHEWARVVATAYLNEARSSQARNDDRVIEDRFPPKFVAPVGNAEYIRRALIQRGWTLEWEYTDVGGGTQSGRHSVRFEERGADLYARISPDTALGSGVAETKVTLTPAGVSYFSPKLGRVRMHFTSQADAYPFKGGAATWIYGSGGKFPDPKHIYLSESHYHAVTRLRPEQ